MVNNLFDFVGLKIKVANPWIDTFAVNCIELPFGDKKNPTKRIVNLEGKEKTDFGISDINGTGFYIKIDPKFVYTPQRQLSSSTKEFQVDVKFRFLFFSINCDVERKKLTLENIFSNNIRKMSFLDYTGIERMAKIAIRQTNTDALTIFKEEINRDLSFGADCIFIAIDGTLSFLSTDDCEQECGISTSENILHSFDFCKPEVFAQLSAEQKACIATNLCEELEACTGKYQELDLISGVADGSNAVFVFDAPPVQVCNSGMTKKLGLAYTVSGNTVTFEPTEIPFTGDVIYAFGYK